MALRTRSPLNGTPFPGPLPCIWTLFDSVAVSYIMVISFRARGLPLVRATRDNRRVVVVVYSFCGPRTQKRLFAFGLQLRFTSICFETIMVSAKVVCEFQVTGPPPRVIYSSSRFGSFAGLEWAQNDFIPHNRANGQCRPVVLVGGHQRLSWVCSPPCPGYNRKYRLLISEQFVFAVVNGHTSIADIKEYEYGGDIFFEILHPPDLQYTYRIRPAKSFGGSFVIKYIY